MAGLAHPRVFFGHLPLKSAADKLMVHFFLAQVSPPQPLMQLACPSPWQAFGDLCFLDRLWAEQGQLGSLYQPRAGGGSECTPGPLCRSSSLGHLNSVRPPLIWPRTILNSGLSPSRIPTKFERNSTVSTTYQARVHQRFGPQVWKIRTHI